MFRGGFDDLASDADLAFVEIPMDDGAGAGGGFELLSFLAFVVGVEHDRAIIDID